jgi:molybdenum cofactor biosynthesis enzyme MoaA
VTRGQQLADILNSWTLDELDAVNITLDAIDDAQVRMQRASERKHAAGGRR